MESEFKSVFREFALSAVAIIGVFALAEVFFDHEKGDERWKRDFGVVTDSTEIYQKVKELYCPPTLRCSGGTAQFVILDDNRKCFISTVYDKSRDTFGEIIAVGDSISKTKGSDSLFVFLNPEKSMYGFAIKRDAKWWK